MTLLISKRHYLLSLLFTLALTGLLIYQGIDLQKGAPPLVQLNRENILFWGLIVVILQLWIALMLLIRHRNSISDLEKISRIGDIEQPQAKKILNRLGPLGLQLEKIMKEKNSLNVLQSRRITALNFLVGQLTEKNRQSIVITDNSGRILGINEQLEERLEKETKKRGWEHILEIRPDINLPEVFNHLEKTRAVWLQEGNSGLSCSPVNDKDQNLQFCIWNLEKSNIVKQMMGNLQESKPEKKTEDKKKRTPFTQWIKRKKEE